MHPKGTIKCCFASLSISRSGSACASASAVAFALTGVEITEKQNVAPRIAGLVLQTVTHNKRRHNTLQRFMRTTDSVTVAIEVPVSFTPEGITSIQQRDTRHCPPL